MTDKEYADLIDYAKHLCISHNVVGQVDPGDLVAESFLSIVDNESDLNFISQLRDRIRVVFYGEAGRGVTNQITKGRAVKVATCKHCEQQKELSDFYLYTDKATGEKKLVPKWCKQCVKDYLKLFYQTPVGKQANRKNFKNYVNKNRDKWNAYLRRRDKEEKYNLTDAYVRRAIRAKGIKNENITPEMIEEKRQWFIEKRNRKAPKFP